ncbi:MAG: DUF4446 family protein [Actinomycetota bacterium]|nr:DUF4446 family protein [Actinomycetota bacterium]
MDDLGTLPGLVALAAGAVALLALALAAVLARRIRDLRRAQTTVLGGEGRDVVAHAERLESAFTELRDFVEEALGRFDDRMGEAERRIDGCVAYRAVIRYDAYGEMSGRQSSSIAFLDARRSGVVLSSILHRDQARLYVKQVREGESEIELSPEEHEAMETALAAERV